MLRPFLVALQLMTRFPIPQAWLPSTYNDELMGRSVLAYPVVGLLIGLLLWAVSVVLNGLPAMVIAALLLLIWIVVTGALHIDGLADCADAWVGGHGDRDKSLAIMKDSYIGPVGVAVVVGILLVKFAALASLQSQPMAIVMAPFIARSLVVILFLTTPYVRAQGLGHQQSQHLPRRTAWPLMLFIFATPLLLLGAKGALLLVGLALVFVLIRWFFISLIGGMSGDTAGALLEVSEALFLVLFLMTF